MLKIGEFSRLSQVTVKMLHHYDDLGLLRPAQAGDGEIGLIGDRITSTQYIWPKLVPPPTFLQAQTSPSAVDLSQLVPGSVPSGLPVWD